VIGGPWLPHPPQQPQPGLWRKAATRRCGRFFLLHMVQTSRFSTPPTALHSSQRLPSIIAIVFLAGQTEPEIMIRLI
jgi:hypothetical protein